MNPLLSDRDVSFLLYELLDTESLCRLPDFAAHSRAEFDQFLAASARLAREVLWPAYRPMDLEPPRFEAGQVRVHPSMRGIYAQLVELGLASAPRPEAVGGQGIPVTVAAAATAYQMAANCGAYGFIGLTAGAAHLVEAFGTDEQRERFMRPMYEGRWTGTMALTEPHAGSSLTDVRSSARPAPDGSYRIKGSKIFISGGDHDFLDNIVHMTLARIEGAPAGIKGVSLFAVPKRRSEGGKLVDNDVAVSGVIHKIGWRGLPSVALELGDRGDCHGWLIGEPHKGISYMFQMMNEARIMVGMYGVATASAAYHESLEYARTRPQGRPVTAKDPKTPQIPIIEHADVRRMLLAQKAIVEGGLALVLQTARWSDLADHASDPAERQRAALLLDLMTPVAKSFPAERGFESNALAVQIHGGYGYTSEYLPESWMRDQKLNSIHEGTTGIHSLDLLGRKVVAGGGTALRAFGEEVEKALAEAEQAGVPAAWRQALAAASATVAQTTMTLGMRGMGGDVEGMLRHSVSYLTMFSTFVVAWLWLRQASAAKRGLAAATGGGDFYEGKLCAAQYWFAAELPRVEQLAALCVGDDDSFQRVKPAWL